MQIATQHHGASKSHNLLHRSIMHRVKAQIAQLLLVAGDSEIFWNDSPKAGSMLNFPATSSHSRVAFGPLWQWQWGPSSIQPMQTMDGLHHSVQILQHDAESEWRRIFCWVQCQWKSGSHFLLLTLRNPPNWTFNVLMTTNKILFKTICQCSTQTGSNSFCPNLSRLACMGKQIGTMSRPTLQTSKFA